MKIEKRTEHPASLRKTQRIPGVIYGKGIKPIPIQADDKEFRDTYKTFGKTKSFKVKLDNKTHQVFIKDVQTDVMNPKTILSFDFLKVEHGNLIKNKVPVRIHGREAMEKFNGIVVTGATEVEVEYSVDKGIDFIDIDVTNCHLGDVIHVRDLRLPDGVKAVEDEGKLLLSIIEAKRGVSEVEIVTEAQPAETPEPETQPHTDQHHHS